MSAEDAVLRNAESRGDGRLRRSCPLYGCQRVYTDAEALDAHVKDHRIHAESLAGKVMLCSAVGCSGSFPSMQSLMEHMRSHHKPNIFFLCESCRAKLRSFRGLLTHLHTCSKVPRRPKAGDGQPATGSQGAFPSEDELPGPQQDPSAPPGHEEGVSQGAPDPARFTAQDRVPARSPLGLDAQVVPAEAPETQGQHHARVTSPERTHQGPHSPPQGSTATWRKNQGSSGSRRILWEHTRGSYRCVQCGQARSSRWEMTQHINTHHGAGRGSPEDGAEL